MLTFILIGKYCLTYEQTQVWVAWYRHSVLHYYCPHRMWFRACCCFRGTSPLWSLFNTVLVHPGRKQPLCWSLNTPKKSSTCLYICRAQCHADQCLKNSSAFPVTGAQVSQAKQIVCRNNNLVIKQQLLVSSTLPIFYFHFRGKETQGLILLQWYFFFQLKPLISVQSSVEK